LASREEENKRKTRCLEENLDERFSVKHPDQEIVSLSDLLEKLRTDRPAGQPVWYRGQDNMDWDLTLLIHAYAKNGLTDVA
jgi:hypothetical protein